MNHIVKNAKDGARQGEQLRVLLQDAFKKVVWGANVWENLGWYYDCTATVHGVQIQVWATRGRTPKTSYWHALIGDLSLSTVGGNPVEAVDRLLATLEDYIKDVEEQMARLKQAVEGIKP